MASTEESVTQVSIGLANLPSQIHRSKVISGFDLNVMVIGESGIGKSTFVNMLFETDIFIKKQYSDFSIYFSEGLEIKSSLVNLCEKGYNVKLEVVDVQGYGRSTPLDSCWDTVGEFLSKRLDSCIEYEGKIERDINFRDPKIHFCLYFFSPNTKRVKPSDIRALKVICDKVSVIPLIGKCDTLTPQELETLKFRIMEDLMANKISIFKFPSQESSNQSFSVSNKNIATSDIFAVMGSDVMMEIGEKKSYCRSYPWGSISVENEKYSDFIRLKNLLILSNLHSVMRNTEKIYERYRTISLCKEGGLEVVQSQVSSSGEILEFTENNAAKEAELEAKFQEYISKFKEEKEALEMKMIECLKLKQKELEEICQKVEKRQNEVETLSDVKESDKKKKDKKKRIYSVKYGRKSHSKMNVENPTPKVKSETTLFKSRSIKHHK